MTYEVEGDLVAAESLPYLQKMKECQLKKWSQKKDTETADRNAIPASREASTSPAATLADIKLTWVKNSTVERRRKL